MPHDPYKINACCFPMLPNICCASSICSRQQDTSEPLPSSAISGQQEWETQLSTCQYGWTGPLVCIAVGCPHCRQLQPWAAHLTDGDIEAGSEKHLIQHHL